MSRPRKRHYWTDTQEKAVIAWQNAKTTAERNKIYQRDLHDPLTKIVEGIATKRGFKNLPNYTDCADACLLQCYGALEQFRPQRGAQAYSYLSVVAKNYFLLLVKEHKTANARDITPYDGPDGPEDLFSTSTDLAYTPDYHATEERAKRTQALVDDLPLWLAKDQVSLWTNKRPAILRAIQALLVDQRWADLDQTSKTQERALIHAIILEDTGACKDTLFATLRNLLPEYQSFLGDQD